TREDRERERAEAVANAADMQGSLRIRDPQAQGEPQQLLRRSGRTRQPETSPQSRSGLDLGMGHPTRTTRPNPPEKNPTRPDPSYVAGGREPYFLTRNNQRAGHGP